MFAVGLKRAAWRGAPFVYKYRAALGKPGLFFVIWRHFTADAVKKGADALQRGTVKLHFFPEYPCKGFFGQVIQRGPQSSGRNNDISTVCSLPDHAFQTLRIIPDYGLVKNINAKLAQSLGDHLCIRIDDISQQDFRADSNQFCIHNK